ncbi:PIWL2 protein, partial [Serilophus lunatus]|nr:PIWL2 protein [Serilophus lunatus]
IVLLVPELTFLTGLSCVQKKDRMVKEVMWEMMQTPQQHYTRLTLLLRRIQDTPEASQELEGWGLHLDTDIYRTQGHILPMERINLRHRSFFPNEELSWHKEVTKDMPISVISLNSWLLVYPKRLQQLAKDLLTAMRSTCGAMGMQVGLPTVKELRDDRIDSYIGSIQSSLGSQEKVQLLVCIIPHNREDMYGAIKKLCCVQASVPSQVISMQSLTGHPGKIRSIVQKVLLQINCKLGGQLWGVDIPLSWRDPSLEVSDLSLNPTCLSPLQKQLMVVGMDVHHSRSRGMHSVIGFVASMNQYVESWGVGSKFSPLLSLLQLNHSLPMKIVVYRDGVSDPQLDTVLKYEVPQIQKSFNTFENYQPSLVVMVVQKQISTNFYSLTGNKLISSPPGTVIDHTITSSGSQDFFLLAHHSRQGCSIPTRYICMCNTANLSPLHLQRLTFKLCHLYWNWPGTIRVPAPCKYAHRLAFLVGQVLRKEPSARLSEQLFFL